MDESYEAGRRVRELLRDFLPNPVIGTGWVDGVASLAGVFIAGIFGFPKERATQPGRPLAVAVTNEVQQEGV